MNDLMTGLESAWTLGGTVPPVVGFGVSVAVVVGGMLGLQTWARRSREKKEAREEQP